MDKTRSFSWGSRIFLLYTGFVAMIIFLVFRSMNEKVDLVATDYYKQELQYQDKLDQIKRANALAEKPVWVMGAENVSFTFPESMRNVTGEICFFKPSDKNLDVRLPLKLDNNGVQDVSLARLDHGAYKVQLSWTNEGVTYFREGVIYID